MRWVSALPNFFHTHVLERLRNVTLAQMEKKLTISPKSYKNSNALPQKALPKNLTLRNAASKLPKIVDFTPVPIPVVNLPKPLEYFFIVVVVVLPTILAYYQNPREDNQQDVNQSSPRAWPEQNLQHTDHQTSHTNLNT